MAGTTKKRPEIRSSEFTEDWEQHRLSEVLVSVSEKNASGKYGQSDVLACSLGTELNRKTIFFGLKSTEESVKSYRIVNIGDVIYTKSPIKGYPNGIVRTCKITDGIVPSLYCVYKKKTDISVPVDTRFIQSYLEDKSRLDGYLSPLVNVGARNNVNITDKGFLEGNILLPTAEKEQKIIVDILEQITGAITLHQLKQDRLVGIKKSCLEKMFPKPGGKVPEMRLGGFADDWRQHGFSEVFDYLQNNSLSRAQLSAEPTEFYNIHYGDVLIKYGAVFDASVDEPTYLRDSTILTRMASSLLHNGDIVMADAAEDETVGKCSEITGLQKNKIVSGLHTIPLRPKEKYAVGFLGYYMNSPSYHDQLLPLMQGTKVSSISKNAISETIILVPPSIEEQKKISKFLRKLDNLITFHQHECEKLKLIKKSLLQKMFV